MIEAIDYSKCTGCRRCVDFCPMDVLRLDTARQEVPSCQSACPAGADMRGYIYLLNHGNLKGAIGLLRQTLPMPAVTGRVCHYPCETECARRDVDEAVNINSLERFVADYWLKEKARPVPRQHASKVAIIGAGPAGLSAAYYLATMGYPVTVFEAMPEPGGMLRYGIPEYRLPRNVLDAQINYILDTGVELRTGVTAGKDISLAELKAHGYKATLLATGAQKSLKLDIPGEKLQGVQSGIDFLKEASTNREAKTGKKVAVIGGGNVAVDSARTALRLGAEEAFVIYRRSKEEMPAFTEGIEAVQSEGAKLVLLTAPTRIVGSNKVEGLECLKMSLGELDASGRRSPVPVPRSEFDIEVDTVVIAIGEAPDTAYWTEIGLTAEGTLKADAGNLTTSVRGIFAGGDAVTGPSSVVEAFASGKRAALSIDCYLKGGAPESLRYGKPVIVGKHPKEGIEKKPRQAAPVSPFTKMKGDFNELKSGFSEETAMREGSRCMSCGSKAFAAYLENCMTCYNCEMGCPYQAVNVDPFRKVMPVLLKIPGDTKNYDVLYTARARGARS